MIQPRFDVIVLTLKRSIDVAKSQGKNIPSLLRYREETGHDGADGMPLYHSSEIP